MSVANIVNSINLLTEATNNMVNKTWVIQGGVDISGSTYYYVGYKKIDSEKWRVMRIKISDYSIDWASGDSDFSTNWTNRASLSYSTL